MKREREREKKGEKFGLVWFGLATREKEINNYIPTRYYLPSV